MPIGCQLCSGFECLKGVYSREVLQKVSRSPFENPVFQQMVGGERVWRRVFTLSNPVVETHWYRDKSAHFQRVPTKLIPITLCSGFGLAKHNSNISLNVLACLISDGHFVYFSKGASSWLDSCNNYSRLFMYDYVFRYDSISPFAAFLCRPTLSILSFSIWYRIRLFFPSRFNLDLMNTFCCISLRRKRVSSFIVKRFIA